MEKQKACVANDSTKSNATTEWTEKQLCSTVLVESFKKIEAQGEGNLTKKNGDMTAVQPALLQCA